MNMQDKVLSNIRFFQLLNEALISDLVIHLQPLRVEPGEIVYHRGDKSNESRGRRRTHVVFFIIHGRVDFYLEYFKIIYKSMSTGTYFGDYEVMCNVVREHTTISKTRCDMLTLCKDVHFRVMIHNRLINR